MLNVVNSVSSYFKEMPRERLVTLAVIGCALAAIAAGSVLMVIGAGHFLPSHYSELYWVDQIVGVMPGATFAAHMAAASMFGVGAALITAGLYTLAHKGMQKLEQKFETLQKLDKQLDESPTWAASRATALIFITIAALTALGVAIWYLHSVSADHLAVFGGADMQTGSLIILGYVVNALPTKLMAVGLAGGSAALGLVAAYGVSSFLDHLKKKKEREQKIISEPINYLRTYVS